MLNCSLHFTGICTILTEWLKASRVSQPDLWVTYHQYSAYWFPSSREGNPKEGSVWHTHQCQVGPSEFSPSLSTVLHAECFLPRGCSPFPASRDWAQLISDGWQYLPWGLGSFCWPHPLLLCTRLFRGQPLAKQGQQISESSSHFTARASASHARLRSKALWQQAESGRGTLVAGSELEAAGVDQD